MIDLVQRSTIHGVNHIYSSKNRILKIFWFLLFIFGIGGIGVNIVFVAKKYISNPVIFSHTLDHESFIWPDLTFCSPTAPFNLAGNSNVSAHWIQTLKKYKEIALMLINETKVFDIVRDSNQSDYELEERTITLASTDPQKLEINDFKDSIIMTTYIRAHEGIYFQEYDNKVPTKISDNLSKLFTTQLVQYGNNVPCHTFHIYKSETINQKYVKALKILLKFDYESYKIFNSSYLFRSIILYINKRNQMPNKPIILLPGYFNYIKLTQSRNLYHHVKRPCRTEAFTVELYDALLQSAKEFEGGIKDCKKIVSQKLYVEKCRCYNPFLPIYKNESGFPRLCLNASMFSKFDILNNAKCIVDVYEQYKNESVFNKFVSKTCSKYKPIKCDTINYKIDTRKDMFIDLWSEETNDRRGSFLEMSYKYLFKAEKLDPNYRNMLRDSVVEIHLERDNPYGDLFTENREYPFSELLSDIGGLMGLWLGMSIVGLFEIAEYFYFYIKDECIMRLKRTEEPNKEDDSNQEL